MELSPRWRLRHVAYCFAIAMTFCYVVITVTSWDQDQEFGPRVTLVRWIEINQIDHARRMLHELW